MTRFATICFAALAFFTISATAAPCTTTEKPNTCNNPTTGKPNTGNGPTTGCPSIDVYDKTSGNKNKSPITNDNHGVASSYVGDGSISIANNPLANTGILVPENTILGASNTAPEANIPIVGDIINGNKN